MPILTILKSQSTVMAADNDCIFKINGQQVYYAPDADGNLTVPTVGAQPITADRSQVINNSDYGRPARYSYSCRKDVTRGAGVYYCRKCYP